MKFSLVVTCFNELRGLARWRAEIEAQTRPPDEIVIVDSASRDGTTEFLKAWADADPRVRVIVQKCKPARGHNIGNEAATYEYIVSTDMGVRLDPHWFEEIVKPFEEDATVDAVAGSVLLDPETALGAAAQAEYLLDEQSHIRSSAADVPGNNSMAYSKRVWRELGGLPEDLTHYSDDSVFGRQILAAEYKIKPAPKALVYWARPHRLADYWKESYNYGRGDGEADIKTPYVFRLYTQGLIPRVLVPTLGGLRVVQKHFSFLAIRRGIRKRQLAALFILPIFLFGKGYFFAKGYLLGYAYGTTHCLNCRQRLSGPLPKK